MRAASCPTPNRWRQAWSAFQIGANVPTWLGLGDDEEFDYVAATARTAEADAPILAFIAS